MTKRQSEGLHQLCGPHVRKSQVGFVILTRSDAGELLRVDMRDCSSERTRNSASVHFCLDRENSVKARYAAS